MPSNLRIMSVYGTRPEAIKIAPLISAITEADHTENVVVVTGQHREMLDQVNDLFGIMPDHDLDIMLHGQSLSGTFARVLERLDPVLVDERPDVVVVQGDTTSSTAAGMAAFHRGIPVVHLEAGLRSYDLASPFPEEGNRRLTSQIASLHLAPTKRNRANLLRESIPAERIVVTGNTVIDALHRAVSLTVPFDDPVLESLASSGRRIVLVTAHRRESWGAAMAEIGEAIAAIARRYPDVAIVLPVHRNPVVRDALLPALAQAENVHVTEPLPYGQFARLMARSALILSDSGGVQEEAPSLGRPVLVLRDSTERPEAVDAGAVRLVGTSRTRIVHEVSRLLTDRAAYEAMSQAISPYGDGTAATRAVDAIRTFVRHRGTSTRCRV